MKANSVHTDRTCILNTSVHTILRFKTGQLENLCPSQFEVVWSSIEDLAQTTVLFRRNWFGGVSPIKRQIKMAENLKRPAEEEDTNEDTDDWVGPMPEEASKPKKKKGKCN